VALDCQIREKEGEKMSQNNDKKPRQDGFTRRDFLKTSAGAVAGGLAYYHLGGRPVYGQSAKELAINIPTDPIGLDPAYSWDASGLVVTNQIYDGLLRYNTDMAILPNVAERWDVVDNTTVVFYLNKNVNFHSGKKVTADDVVYSFDYVMTKENNSVKRGNFLAIDKVEKEDDYTVKFTLKEPFSPFLDFLASAGRGIKIVDKDLRTKTAETRSTISPDPTGAGTGPFRFVKWLSSNQIVMEKHDGYHLEGLPKLDKVTWRIIGEASTAVANFAGRRLDILFKPSFSTYDAVIQNPDVIGKSKPSFECEYIWFNNAKPPFNDVNLRKAVSYAINRQEILDKVFRGHGILASGPLPPNSPYWNPETEGKTVYDPDEAVRYLKKAGKANGFEFEMLVTAASWFPPQAEIVQEQLSKVGIKAQVTPMEKGAAFDRAFKGDFHCYLEDAVGRITHPDNILFRWYHPEGQMGKLLLRYVNPRVTELLEAGRRTFDVQEQKKCYDEVQLIIQEEQPSVQMLWHDQAEAVWKWVKNYEPTPVATPFLREVDIEK
jgi:peptide/nickel transport system substrate-binding protein